MKDFSSSHVTLVTGASLGIGAAAAREFASRGSCVAVHYNKSEQAAKEVAASIQSAGGQATIFQADLSDHQQCCRLVAEVLQQMNRIDVLVNNAGSLVGRRSLLEIDEAFWSQVMNLNMNSVLWVSQPVITHMMERKSGAIINLGSIAGHNGGGPGAMPDAASKAAVTGMTKGMAKELISSGIRVNAVNPGVILTPFHERFSNEERMRSMVSQIPQGRAGEANEVARVIAFLAYDDASHIVGESIEVNGGMLMD